MSLLAICLWALVGFIITIPVASFFEWFLHRYVMHRPVGKFRYPFEAHAVVHHQIFKADHTYHLVNEKDKETIPMAWWNGPILVVLAGLPVYGPCLLFGSLPMAVGSFVASAAYYMTYEYIHWCMHLPKNRRVEQPAIYRRLNGHHLLHHRYMHKNFNVVLPLADLIMGTLMVRSKIKFAQATGPAVPNVQPIEVDAPENTDAKPEDGPVPVPVSASV
jgi:hypothetical protein